LPRAGAAALPSAAAAASRHSAKQPLRVQEEANVAFAVIVVTGPGVRILALALALARARARAGRVLQLRGAQPEAGACAPVLICVRAVQLRLLQLLLPLQPLPHRKRRRAQL